MARPAKYDRDVMLEKALDLFWTRGYEATSVQDLLTGLDIHRGTLYDSFGDKHTLYLEVLDFYQKKVGAKLLTILQQPGSKKAAIQALFQTMVNNFATDNGRRGCLYTNATMELSLCDEQVAAKVALSQQQLGQGLLKALQEAQAAGEIPSRSPQELQVLAAFLLNNLQGLRVLARTHENVRELHQIAKLALAALD
ncbi:TetR/AcrR family transcriptional regulator [Hymenobacter taeanensis]|uniref:TetR/AcrR family transcriptional regulator n=1 Tax=Hymenobacter taeanensis TaxID=2735321 RepID=A0A6M6BLL2_9BACT|nr:MULTISPECIES: TetR/AcrR family transcriptional regulator [Hymenobacter]QJX47975.1 TetR/AcrR family transcriptional regulator [Hymenobacter taeanensis]UOQ82577.1 TetR/AcrR family transcriptional regulator [Hymenobacter sp. 5414T-23]